MTSELQRVQSSCQAQEHLARQRSDISELSADLSELNKNSDASESDYSEEAESPGAHRQSQPEQCGLAARSANQLFMEVEGESDHFNHRPECSEKPKDLHVACTA
mmetsp:Transcript_30355/g.47549  ORF Transcript_30355/g.47549 Transcript_30355/m.47549 type:complete len:105 (+) Transcript_30355:1271-1585(+)